MAGMPPIPMDPGALDTGESESAPEDAAENYSEEADPQFAADISACKPLADWTDEDIACLQRAILGLLGK